MKGVKCIIFDLDNTLWEGIALWDKVKLKAGIKDILDELDKRGIIMSISSKGDATISLPILKEFGIQYYFLYPQVTWDEKEISIKKISDKFGILLDEIAFVDDDIYELEKIKKFFPDIMCINATDINKILEKERFQVKVITQEAKNRRLYFQSEIKFKSDIKNIYNQEDFFQNIRMCACLRKAVEKDIERIYELIFRTNKMNTLDSKYELEYLVDLVRKQNIIVLDYMDIYYSHGIVGGFYIKEEKSQYVFEMITISCRMISRNIGKYILSYFTEKLLKRKEKVCIHIQFTEKNCVLKSILKGIGYYTIGEEEMEIKVENFKGEIPEYLKIIDESE